jgi:tRNA dimethylallyltransferase
VAPTSGGRDESSADMSELVIAIFGPTASGKTAVGELVADRIGGEVVSADSMQVYRGVPILTAQPTRPTRLVAMWPLSHEASVGEYAALAHAAIDKLLGAGRTPVVAGGTGLYLRAALAELELPPAPQPGARARWQRLYDDEGAERVHATLADRDPATAATVHPNDRRRVVRALELTDAGASLRPPKSRLWGEETRHPTIVFGLDVPKEELDRRIADRAHAMLEAGGVQEAKRAIAGPLSSTARHILGLLELTDLPADQALDELVARTRRYAAYQRKWMRRIPGVVSVEAHRPTAEIADEILLRVRDLTASSGKGGAPT